MTGSVKIGLMEFNFDQTLTFEHLLFCMGSKLHKEQLLLLLL